jgi:glycosyltransferase involved in cell wall biosynthesis
VQVISKNKDLAKPSFCVLLPSYNNDGTLKHVIEQILSVNPNLIVINDGSTDQTAQILEGIRNIEVIHFNNNLGKGMALRAGFLKAHELGYNYAISIDSDGQHDPRDILKLEEKARLHPGALIMGSRNMDQEGIPSKSSFGNNFSNFWYWAETLNKLGDTQTGFRVYPIKSVANKQWFTKRFEFEIEVIVRLAWDGVPVYEVPVSVKYPEDRVSHFRPFADFMRISLLNTVLFILALLFYLPRKIIRSASPRKIISSLKTEMKRGQSEPVKMAASVGLGLFFGIFPIWGFQMLVAFAVASFLKLNRIVVLLSSNISTPPLTPFIIFLSYELGYLFVADPVQLPALDSIDTHLIYLQINQYLIGSVLLSVFVGVLGFAVSYVILTIISKRGD